MPEKVNNQDEIETRARCLVEKAFKNLTEDYVMEVSTDLQNGDNYMGILYNVTIRVKQKETLHLILKVAPQEAFFRQIFPVKEIYHREIFVYDNVISEFFKIQRENELLQIFQPFATHYVSSIDSMQEALLMEDMKKKGFKRIDHRVSLDYPHALLVMKELGKFHALSYAIRHQKRETFKKWEDKCQECYFNNVGTLVIDAVIRLAKAVLSSYSTHGNEMEKRALEHFINTLPDVYNRILVVKEDDEYAVVNHGDFEMRNLLFKYENSITPTELCMLDWQLARIGSPALDILFFIFVTSEKDLREQYHAQLIREYYRSLSEFLRQLGSDPEILLPFEVLLKHLQEYAPFGLYTALLFVATNMKEVDDVPDYLGTINEDVVIEMMSTVPKGGYLQRMRDIVSDFVTYGYHI